MAEEQENGMTKGMRVKEDGRVLSELAASLGNPANVACRIEKFGNVVENLSPLKERWVAEMGFDGLLNLVGSHLPRSLCYWLATRVDCEKKELVSRDGMKFPLSKAQVHWVFGLPYGPYPVPNKVSGKRMKKEVKIMKRSYGSVTKKGTREIRGQALIDAVENLSDKLEFKRAFMMFALNEVLCPTTSYRLSQKLLPAATVYEEADQYDWCSLVLDHLLHLLKSFSSKFDKFGFVPSCGGCTFYLAVLYLDRLKRPPLSWGVLPRVKVWSSQEVNKAKAEDRTESGDYGKIGCMDVAYGFIHPFEARDAFPELCQQSNANVRAINQYYTAPPPRYKRKKRLKATNGNPYERKLQKRMREAAGMTSTGALQNNPSPSRTPIHPGDSDRFYAGPSTTTENQQLESADANLSNCVDGRWKEADYNNMAEEHNLDEGDEGRDETSDPQTPNNVSKIIHDICGSYGKLTVMDNTGWGSWGKEIYSGHQLHPDEREVAGIDYVAGDSSDNDEDNCNAHQSDEPSDQYVPIYISEESSPPPGFGDNVLPQFQSPATDLQPGQESGHFSSGNTYTQMNDRSHEQRVVRPSCRYSPFYVKAWRPEWNRSSRMKLYAALKNYAGDPIVVVNCDGACATVSLAMAVTSFDRDLDEEYVAAVAKLYTKVWASKWSGRSKKIMVQPSFAIDAINLHNCSGKDTTVRQDTLEQLVAVKKSKSSMINAIFIPVLEETRWWAVAFSFNRQEIRVMDPTGRSLEALHEHIMILDTALRAMWSRVFPKRNIGSFDQWSLIKADYADHCDSLGSGVATLMSVKRCEDRFNATLYGVVDTKQRAWLLCEDLLNDFNNAKDQVKALLQSSAV